MDDISNNCGWTIVVIFKITTKIKQYFSIMHINKTHVILGFRVSNEFGKFILTLCLSLICCVLCMNCGQHHAHGRCKFDFYIFFVWVHHHVEQFKALSHPSSN
jgi:hypothetical protein